MSPKIDFAFKELMQNEKVRNGFLGSILNLKPEMIKETVIIDSSLRKRTEEEKLGILDVRVLLHGNISDSIIPGSIISDSVFPNLDTEIDIEIQVSYFKEWRKRSLFYWSKMYSDSLKVGDEYEKLKPCISISILDFTLITGDKEFFSCYQLMETTRHTIYTDLIKFYVIELPKLPKKPRFPTNARENKDVYLWAKFIASERKEEMEMLANENPQISVAYDKLKIISNDEQMKRDYEARQRAIRDTISLKKQYRDEAKEEARKEIKEEVRNEVKEEVRNEVRNEVKEEVRNEVRNEVKEELRNEVKKELRDEVKEEVNEDVKAEERKRINSLYLILTKNEKINDILRCTEDTNYLNHLLNEYNL